MRLASALLSALAAFAGFAAAQDDDFIDQIARQTYGDCPFTCIKKYIGDSTCKTLANIPCVCKNEELAAQIEGCVAGTCTIWEGLQTKNITETQCGRPVRDKHTAPLVLAITGGTLASLAFAMRLGTLLFRKAGRSIGPDDYLAGAALLLAAPPTLTAMAFRDNGLGKDIWTLQLHQIKNVLMYYYLGSVFYIASIAMIKISLVFFMLRVFPDKKFRIICFVTMGFVVAYGISFVTATSLQCWPVTYAWQRIDDEKKGTCNDVHLQAWFASIFNIVLDLVLLVLPLKNLWGLQMTIKKKLMVMLMFSLGLFVTVISVIRLHTLIRFANSTNITWDYVEPGYWSLMEMHASIICACLPYCRHFLISFGATFLRSTQTGDSRGFTSGNKSTTGTRQKTTSSQVLSVSKAEEGQHTPKHGDEGDFVPLVEYPNRNWDKSTRTTASVANTGSTDSL